MPVPVKLTCLVDEGQDRVQKREIRPRGYPQFRILALEESRIFSHPGPEERDPGGGRQMLKGAGLCLDAKLSSESLVVRPPCPLAILARYGSIAASPHAVDVVSFALETRHGSWVAQMPVKPKGISKRKKTFAEPRFRFFSETAGRFASLLPQKPEGGSGDSGLQ